MASDFKKLVAERGTELRSQVLPSTGTVWNDNWTSLNKANPLQQKDGQVQSVTMVKMIPSINSQGRPKQKRVDRFRGIYFKDIPRSISNFNSRFINRGTLLVILEQPGGFRDFWRRKTMTWLSGNQYSETHRSDSSLASSSCLFSLISRWTLSSISRSCNKGEYKVMKTSIIP
jgi:hypothetical protein